MNRTRRSKGRDDIVHFLRKVHHTESRMVMEMVVMTETQKAANRLHCMLPQAMKFKPPVRCKFGDKCAYRLTAKLADAASIAVQISSNDEGQMPSTENVVGEKTNFP